MLHKRCDIKDLIDSKIREFRHLRDEAQNDGNLDLVLSYSGYIDGLQDVRYGIFDEVLDNEEISA